MLQTGQTVHADPAPIDLTIMKQRNGPIGIVPLFFMRRYTKFVEPGSHEATYSKARLGDAAA